MEKSGEGGGYGYTQKILQVFFKVGYIGKSSEQAKVPSFKMVFHSANFFGSNKCFSSCNFVSTQPCPRGFFEFFYHGKENNYSDDVDSVDSLFVWHIGHIASVMAADSFKLFLEFFQ